MKVLNKSDVSRTIEVKHADGSIGSVTLHRGRPVNLPEGVVVNPSRVGEYKAFLKSEPPLDSLLNAPAVPAAPVSVKTPSSSSQE